MNFRTRCARFTLALALAAGPATAAAQALPASFRVDELGNGTLDFGGLGTFQSIGLLMPDPGPGGLASALTYSLLGPPSLVGGDVLIFEPGSRLFSDVIRFNPDGTAPGSLASLVFYSDLPEPGEIPPLADVGFPAAFYTNVLSFLEADIGNGEVGLIYHPTQGQPGFVDGFDVTYRIVSDAEAVTAPEPATVALLGGGLLALAAVARRRRA